MFSHRSDERVGAATYLGWFLLCFLAGNLNVGGFLALGKFVSHVTGFATLAGVSLEAGDWFEALGILTIPLFFLIGVMVSGYFTERRDGKEGIHRQIMFLVAFLMAIAVAIGGLGGFGAFASSGMLRHDYGLLALLCGACGLVNAAVTSSSGATVRTTHLTGMTTDLGLGLIRAEVRFDRSGRGDLGARSRERRANLFRIGKIISFTSGSAIGAFVYAKFEYWGFLLPMLLALGAGWVSTRTVDT